MKTLVILVALALSGCSMTPTQKKWTTIGVSVVVTGMIIAHEQDKGNPVLVTTSGRSKHDTTFNPCPSGNSRACK